MSEKTDILSVAREFLARNKLEPWEDVTVPVSALRRLAQAVIDLSAELKAFDDAGLREELHRIIDEHAALEGKDLGGLVKRGSVMAKQKCPICREDVIDIDVNLPTCCYVRFCKACLLSLPGAIAEALAEYLPEEFATFRGLVKGGA